MFSYIIGEIKDIREDYIVLENNNIGYKIYMPSKNISEFIKNETHKIYTEFVVRDDQISLYGFKTFDEFEMFLSLNTVSSIGPKAAMSILSTLSLYELRLAILENDINTITKAPGIGKKSASRIILELTDKIDIELLKGTDKKSSQNIEDDNYQVALDGLIGLGYTKFDAEKVLKDIEISEHSLSDIMKIALKRMS